MGPNPVLIEISEILMKNPQDEMGILSRYMDSVTKFVDFRHHQETHQTAQDDSKTPLGRF